MNRFILAGACAAMLAAFAADAGANPAGRPTGLDRAVTRMNAQGLSHSQAVQRFQSGNPVTRPARPTPPSGTIPATPATPATPPAPGSREPATPATPAIPAIPGKPNKPGD